MNKKTLAILLALLAAAGAGVAAATGAFSGAKEVGVSALKGNPGAYLGKVAVTGKAGNVHPDKGIIEMVDEKACCAIYLIVPTTPEQQKGMESPNLYRGEFPRQGQSLTATAVVEKSEKGYTLTVLKVESGGETLIRKL